MLITTLVVSFLVCCMLEVMCCQAGVVSGLQVQALQVVLEPGFYSSEFSVTGQLVASQRNSDASKNNLHHASVNTKRYQCYYRYKFQSLASAQMSHINVTKGTKKDRTLIFLYLILWDRNSVEGTATRYELDSFGFEPW